MFRFDAVEVFFNQQGIPKSSTTLTSLTAEVTYGAHELLCVLSISDHDRALLPPKGPCVGLESNSAFVEYVIVELTLLNKIKHFIKNAPMPIVELI